MEDLVCLSLSGLNIILSRDWLSANHVMLNCSDKTIVFSSTPFSESMIPISLYVNSLAINCCGTESQGNVLLLASVLEYEQNLSEIPMVREYPNVFLEDIPEFSLEREIEFSIDLVSRMGPISIAVYKNVAFGVVELKKKIEELLEKQFIRPSASPWEFLFS